ncbi:hypothetical protein AAVH_00279 [Aphelenchoides avenae]|nr:hypothetical protein AAVH_00279 [Aphelenchus avenae]
MRSTLSPPAFDTYRSLEQGVVRAERVKSIDDVATEKQRQKFKTSTKFYIPRISLSKRNVSKVAMESFSALAEDGIARDFTFHSSALRYAGSTPGSSEESVLRIFIDPDAKNLTIKSPTPDEYADSGIENNRYNSTPNSPTSSTDYSPRS